MTIHRAKGLEFPVVCVADLGKDGREDDSALRITDDGRVGMRLASMGGGSDRQRRARAHQGSEQKLEDEEEERRIFYVAATRAQEHLILSGATDLEKLPGAGRSRSRCAGSGGRWRPTWPRWAHGVGRRSTTAATVRVRCEVLRPDDGRRAAARGRPRPGAPRARAARPGGARGAGAGGRPGPGGAARQPPQLLRASRPTTAAATASTSSGRCELPRPRRCRPRPAARRATRCRPLLRGVDRAPAARAARLRGPARARGRARSRALIESHGEPVREHEVGDLIGDGRARSPRARSARGSPPPQRRAPSCRSRSRSTPQAGAACS